jgi:acyl-CoA synthetase (AMP-forming)/AMP-acid ligase II
MSNVAEILRWRSRVHPDRDALRFEGRRRTFRQLNERANRLANALLAAGVRPRERIAVYDKGTDRVVETMFACAKIGAVFTPINWRLAPGELTDVVRDSTARIVFVGGAFDEKLASCRAELDSIDLLIGYDGARDDAVDFEMFLQPGGDRDPEIVVSPDETAWQIYTSGTTAAPKGVELTHRNLFSSITGGLINFGSVKEPVTLACMPLFHIGGVGYLLSSLFCGSTVVLTREANPSVLLDLLEREKVTHTLLVPALINFLLEQEGVRGRDFSSLQQIVYGGSPIPEELLETAVDVFGCGFLQGYGLTETTGAISHLPEAAHNPRSPKLRSCGLPLLGQQVRILTADGRPCDIGETGEIVVRGSNVMKGYWNNPQATAEAIRDGWLHTGDAAFQDEQGYLYIQDRIKDMIVTGGENVFPAEVEAALQTHPEVLEVAVIGVPDARWGEAVKAIVVRTPQSRIDEPQIIEYCRQRIAGYKCPRSVDIIESLPRTPTGKVLKTELRARYWQGRMRRVN